MVAVQGSPCATTPLLLIMMWQHFLQHQCAFSTMMELPNHHQSKQQTQEESEDIIYDRLLVAFIPRKDDL
jgi:hypothetical protein